MKSLVSEKPSAGLALLWAIKSHGGCPEETSSSEIPLPAPPHQLCLLGLPFTIYTRAWAAYPADTDFLTVWRLKVQDQAASRFEFWGELSSRRAVGGLLAMSSDGTEREPLSGVSSHKDVSLFGSGPCPYDLI